jgi:hypothetical protein
MTWNYFFKDRSGGQNGPVSLDELIALAKVGRIAPDCLVWSEGGEPAPAGQNPSLAAVFGAAPVVGGAGGGGPLIPDLPAWGLFWRGVVLSIGVALVVTAPWAGLWFYRWVSSRISLAAGQRLSLQSEVGDCWPIFVGIGLTQVIPVYFKGGWAHGSVQLLCSLASMALAWMLVGWFCRSLRSENGALNIAFQGGVGPYIGWSLLMGLSIFTIIGWAWVLKFQMRWICRNVVGSHAFDFVGSAWEILWRTFAMVIGCMFILPIPWVLSWYANWVVSQFVVTPGAAASALQQAA